MKGLAAKAPESIRAHSDKVLKVRGLPISGSWVRFFLEAQFLRSNALEKAFQARNLCVPVFDAQDPLVFREGKTNPLSVAKASQSSSLTAHPHTRNTAHQSTISRTSIHSTDSASNTRAATAATTKSCHSHSNSCYSSSSSLLLLLLLWLLRLLARRR